MKNPKSNGYRLIVFVTLFLASCNQQPFSDNLIVNGDAEVPKYDTVPSGWSQVSGHWVSFQEDSISHDVLFAQHGHYIFFAGSCISGFLQQEIDVSKYARQIDANEQQFIFNGFAQSLDQGDSSDQSVLYIHALDSTKEKSLYIFSDTSRSRNKWLAVSDTFMTPSKTRFIRIGMGALRHVGGYNDGYLDHLSLVTRSLHRFPVWAIILAVIFAIGGVAGFIWYKGKTMKRVNS